MFTLGTSVGEFQVNFKFDESKFGERTTICQLFKDGEEIIMADAICNPKDNFSKITGRKIAFGRAIGYLTAPFLDSIDYSLDHTIESNKQLRTELWNAYFSLPMRTR